MVARQQHGFDFENTIINKYNLKKTPNGHKRDSSKDQFYTDPKVAEHLVSTLGDVSVYTKIIEPSAGCGSFLNYLPQNTISYDIEPKDPRIIKQDYLQTQEKPGKILVIGNPPFGKQSSLAKKFIKHSCKFAEVIAFILPKSFKKESMQKCFDTYFHLFYQEDLEIDSFFYEETRYKVPCVFQIWKKSNLKRPEPLIHIPNNTYYSIVKKEDNPSVAFRRVGITTGNFNTNIQNSSTQSNIFIKFHVSFDLSKISRSMNFDTDNTVGQKSVSKNELIRELNRFFE